MFDLTGRELDRNRSMPNANANATESVSGDNVTQTANRLFDQSFSLLPYDVEKRDRYWQTCIDNIFSTALPTESGVFCNRTKDIFGCWPDTPAGQMATIACPDYIINFHAESRVSRLCMSNGTWATFKRSLYRPCVDAEGTYRAIVTYYVGYSLSIVACIIALIIFAAFRSLRCPRVTIHQNLFLTYIWTGVFWITFYALQGGAARQDNAYAGLCKTVHVLATYMTLSSYCWMFCEGLYLYVNLVFAFVNSKKVLTACIFIGWTTPVPFVFAYTLGVSLEESPGMCWEVPSAWIWFTQGLACATLILNLFFVSHIVYILITKMRDVQTSEQQQIRKVAKAILVLVPLLGLQYLLTPIAPDSQHKFYGLYVVISASIAATQGLFVAIVFCFANGDVLKTIRRKLLSHQYLSRFVPQRKNTDTMHYSTGRQASVDARSAPGWKNSQTGYPAKPASALVSAPAPTAGDYGAPPSHYSNNLDVPTANGDADVTETLLGNDTTPRSYQNSESFNIL